MKLFLKLLFPGFWKPRELLQWGIMPLAWLRVRSGFGGNRAGQHMCGGGDFGDRAWVSQKRSSTRPQPQKVDLRAD